MRSYGRMGSDSGRILRGDIARGTTLLFCSGMIYSRHTLLITGDCILFTFHTLQLQEAAGCLTLLLPGDDRCTGYLATTM